jgi:hypothetical protein
MRLVEFVPRKDCADVHKPAEVEEYVDARVDLLVTGFCFGEVAAIPVECVAGEEAGEEVVGADAAACPEDKELIFWSVSVKKNGWVGDMAYPYGRGK